MTQTTKQAIRSRINNGEHHFFVGDYYYELSSGMLRRREQRAGYTPTSDWELLDLDEVMAS